jgi:hypothetical protein
VAPSLAERVSGPLVGNHTLRGSDFSSLGLGPFEGLTYVVRNQAVLMPTVMPAVVHRGLAFLGGAAARGVSDVGADMTGRHDPSFVAP